MDQAESIVAAGVRLGAVRKLKRIEQTKVASDLGISQPHLSRVETGKKPASFALIEQLCAYYGVDVAEVLKPSTPITGGVTGAHKMTYRNDGRAMTCPRCGEGGHADSAKYCGHCAYPLYNFCSTPERHANRPVVRFCETCGAKTLWGMDESELDQVGIQPLLK